MKTNTLIPLITVGLATLGQAAFITDISAWSQFGDVGFISGAATTTNAVSTGTDDLVNLNLSGNDPGADVGLEAFSLVDFFANGYTAMEGSALKQTFSVLAGESVSFNWQFLTNDSLDDIAFASLDGVFILLADSAAATSGPAFGFSQSVSGTYTSAPFGAPATVTLALGVADTDDFSVSSALRVPTIVPEPSAPMLFCIAALFASTRRRRA